MDLLLPLVAGAALGIVMGLLGGGGGVLAVPVLLALGLSLDAASTTSLAVVGIGALAGLLTHARSGRVDWRIGAVFGVLGTVGAVAGSRLSLVVDDRWQLAGFVVLLLLAAWGMLRGRRVAPGDDEKIVVLHWGRMLVLATGVGLVTGFFGVGGGFIAVPALVLAVGMPMRRASATALLVIVINTAVAFAAHGTSHIDGRLTAVVAVGTAVGAVLGATLQPRVDARALQRAFGVLLLLVAAYETVQFVTA